MQAAWLRSTWLLIAAVLVFGCYRPKYADCEISCGQHGMCPEGLTCSSGHCTRTRSCSPGDAGPGADRTDPRDGLDDLPAPDAPIVSDAGDAAEGSDAEDARNPDGIGPADADGPPWTPMVIENLVLWLEADRISATRGTPAMSWQDQSAWGNHAGQAETGFRPVVAANVFNDLSALQFANGTWMLISDAPSMRWGLGDFLLMVVFRSQKPCRSDGCSVQTLYDKSETAEPWAGPSLHLRPYGQIEGHLSHAPWGPGQDLFSAETGYDDGLAHVVGIRRRANRPSLRIDGVDQPGPEPQVIVNVDANGQGAHIGARGLLQQPPDQSFTGYIGAIIGVKGPISEAHLEQLESYLMTKYGVAR